MAEYLGQHPDVFVARGEPHFFGSDIHYNPVQMTKDEYLSLFSEAGNERRVGEKSTWYLYSEKAAEEIKTFYSHAKIIIQIRNPVEMMYSLHGHLLHTGHEDIVDFEKALEAEEDRKKGVRIPRYTLFPENLFYSEVPLYTDQIKRYIKAFGWSQIHIIVFDDLIKDTSLEYRKVLRFLAVNDQFTPEFILHNPQRPKKSFWLHKMVYNTWIRMAARSILPGNTRNLLGKMFSNMNVSSNDPPMDKTVRRQLQKHFMPEVERLSQLLDRDLTYWCEFGRTS